MSELSTLEILERRERELLNQFESVRIAFAKIQDELHHVSLALRAIRSPVNPFDQVAAILAPGAPTGPSAPAGPTGPTGPTGGILGYIAHPEQMASIYGLGVDPIAPRGSLADEEVSGLGIKELILRSLKARRDYLLHGATSSELLDAIKEYFGRDVDRSSLSPTLSRMKADKVLQQTEEGKWQIARDLFG
jgi:hypothetical protein